MVIVYNERYRLDDGDKLHIVLTTFRAIGMHLDQMTLIGWKEIIIDDLNPKYLKRSLVCLFFFLHCNLCVCVRFLVIVIVW